MDLGNWQKYHECKIAYTFVIQKWVWKKSFCKVWHFAPWRKKESFKKRESYDKNKHSFNIVPAKAKNELGKENEIFKDKIEYSSILD